MNLANKIESSVFKSKQDAESVIPADNDGTATVSMLEKTTRIIYRISNRTNPEDLSSLNLHPLVYFYSNSGKHLPTSFSAIVELMYEYEKNSSFVAFTLIRKRFEEFLINHKDYLQQISRSNRGQMKAVHKIKDFLAFIVKQLREYNGDDDKSHLHKALLASEFSFLKPPVIEHPHAKNKDFSAAVKSVAFIKEKLDAATRCEMCGARVPDYGISFDHAKDKKFGGGSEVENVHFAHHFCNSAKDAILKKAQAAVVAK